MLMFEMFQIQIKQDLPCWRELSQHGVLWEIHYQNHVDFNSF